MSGHTPGPWVLDPRGFGAVRTAAHEAGRQYANGWGLPQVALAVGLPEHRPEGEQQANARLIAAAPALLAALEDVMPFVNFVPFDVEKTAHGLAVIEAARAAIALARGAP